MNEPLPGKPERRLLFAEAPPIEIDPPLFNDPDAPRLSKPLTDREYARAVAALKIKAGSLWKEDAGD